MNTPFPTNLKLLRDTRAFIDNLLKDAWKRGQSWTRFAIPISGWNVCEIPVIKLKMTQEARDGFFTLNL